jgi:hypothetical protein
MGSKRTTKARDENALARAIKYKVEYCDMARKLCEMGADIAMLADFFGVPITAICEWQSTYLEFFEACKAGQDRANDRVERALYERSVGYTHDVVKVVHHKGDIFIVRHRKHALPDPAAGTYWLKNRRKKKWADKPDTADDDMHDDPLTVLARQLVGTALRPKEYPVDIEESNAPDMDADHHK